MKVLLIIPAYNESNNLNKIMNDIAKYNYDAIIINDHSIDNTEELCIKNNYPFITLISNLGIGGAVQTGYKYAEKHNYDIAIQFDGDGQHNIADVEKLIKPIKNNTADFVIGSRFLHKNEEGFKSTVSRRIGIKLISLIIGFVCKQKITDPTSGFRAANKKIIHLFSDLYPVEYPEPESTVYLIKNNYRVKEIDTIMNERIEGKSSIRALKSLYYMINVILSIIVLGFSYLKGDEH
ncbi:glycosyltransferase family 2 protein [[Clostridium] innocuum]|nr:glycosyltransferase family 2 protein [[Clostridium] innocuum]